jgi:hypothetical protein
LSQNKDDLFTHIVECRVSLHCHWSAVHDLAEVIDVGHDGEDDDASGFPARVAKPEEEVSTLDKGSVLAKIIFGQAC